MVAIPNASYFGVPPLGTIAGAAVRYPPHWAAIDLYTGGFSTTSTRLYYIPYYFSEIVAYTGLISRNTGSSDNGETYRCGVYQKNQSTNKPGTLIQDCGEVTLTGAAADRTLATSFTPAYIGWHYLAYHANSAAAMVQMMSSMSITAAGMLYGVPLSSAFGIPGFSAQSFGAYYVDTTYGALASSAVAPTAVTGAAPALMPYRT